MESIKNYKVIAFQDYDDISVSTKTFIASTNLTINIDEIFNILPVLEFTVIPKKRGRRRKNQIEHEELTKPYGSILTLKYREKIRGTELKVKKSRAKSGVKSSNSFRNSFTIVIQLDKVINLKIYTNGTFQMTGCKNHNHAEECIKIMWNFIKDRPGELYTFKNSDRLEILLIQCMRNIDFSLGFKVDREKLSKYLHSQSELGNFNCILKMSFGYTGVTIKIPLDEPIEMMKIKKLIYDPDFIDENGTHWRKQDAFYKEYIDNLKPRDQKNKIDKKRFISFQVFHSGQVILSSINSKFMKPYYYKFLSIIQEGYDKIEERLDI